MIVPNYVPEPLEVRSNVTQEPYARRLVFIRRVVVRHALCVLAIALMIAATGTERMPPRILGLVVGPWWGIGLFAGLLILLDLVRIARRGQRIESKIGAITVPLVVVFAAIALRGGYDAGWPIEAPLFGFAATWIYSGICGRDYSFVGAGVFALVASTAALAAAGYGPTALWLNAVVVVYHVYDLASLMSRRRMGEEWAAAVDLFRDVFNVFGYVPRVWRHWKRHRIWADLPIPPPLIRPSRIGSRTRPPAGLE